MDSGDRAVGNLLHVCVLLHAKGLERTEDGLNPGP